MRVRIILLLAGAALCAGPVAGAHGAWPGANGELTFSSGGDIIAMPLGGPWQRLTTDPADDAQSSWSPDGKRIAFRSRRDGHFEVYVMNADGSGQTRLTTTPSPGTFSTQPAWSPDGKRLLFRSNREGGPDADIWVMNADGTDQRKVITLAGDERYPSFSPDGKRILFRNDGDGDTEIFTMASNGTDVRKLTDNGVFDGGPAWSPDGRQIAFERGPGTGVEASGPADIWIMNADGTNQHQVTMTPSHDEGPAWSPDGTKIAFTSLRSGNSDIWLMNPDGSSPIQLTFAPTLEESPDWQPLPPSAAPPPAATPRIICRVIIPSTVRVPTLGRRGLSITLGCPARVQVTAELVVTGAQARKAGLSSGASARLFRVTRTISTGRRTIHVRPRASVMRRLRHVRSVTLRDVRPLLTVTTRDANQHVSSVFRSFRLSR